LQDGQNLFDDNAPYGNWAIDVALENMAKHKLDKIIVVAIDHGNHERVKEYTPFYDTKLGPGDGKKYIRFVTDTLKPHIDKNYRTLPGREHTGLGGSSMGGLISIYGGLMYPEEYGKLMIFSPALWVTPNIPFRLIPFFHPLETKIYLYAGGKESENMIPNVRRFKQALEAKGEDTSKIDFKLSIDPNGVHNEWHWQKEFPKAVEWLFFDRTLTDEEE
jgi:predicted alpha/beta superfamily hydrolase